MLNRSKVRCVSWLFLATLPLLGYFSLDTSDDPLRLALVGALFLFCAQGFLSELIGVRADANGASFPRRLPNGRGLPVFWRMHIPVERISRVDHWEDCVTRLFLNSGKFIDVTLTDSAAAKNFVRNVGVCRASHHKHNSANKVAQPGCLSQR
jgi:hypothetical protein